MLGAPRMIPPDPPDPHDLSSDREAVWLRDVFRPDEPNLTVRAVFVGMAVGAVMCLSNLYVYFKTGWSLGVTLTACILAFAAFQALHAARITKRPLGVLENNALTTVASGAGYMTAGGNMAAFGALLMVLTPPMLMADRSMWTDLAAAFPDSVRPLPIDKLNDLIWRALESGFLLSREPKPAPATLPMILWFAVIAAMGVFVAIPIKRQLINREALAFPTGTATAETIRSIHHAGGGGTTKIRALAFAALLAAAVKWLVSAWKIIPDEFSVLPIQMGGHALKSWTLSFKTELVLVAAGALMSFRTGWSLLIGGLATYGLLAPWLVHEGYVTTVSYKAIVQWTLWPGASILVSAGLVSFALDYKSLARSFSGLTKMFGGSRRGGEQGIDAVEAPEWWFPVGFLLLAPIAIVLLATLFGIPFWAGIIAVFLAILMGFVAARVTGETDITPTKALGPVTQITFGALTPGNLTGNIMSANVTGGIGLHAADLLTTLKTGWLLGARSRHQVYAQLFGVVAGAIFIVPAFTILIPDPAMLGNPEWPAPSCVVWEGVSRAFSNGIGALDDSIKVAMVIGLVIGTTLTLLEKLAPKRLTTYVPSANGLGIAMVIPGGNSIAMFVGSLVAEILRRKQRDGLVVPVASGLIAGESLMGIVIALLVGAGILAK